MLKDYLVELLKNEQLTTIEILDRINDHFRHGSSRQQLGNVLGKNKIFQKIGMVKLKGLISGCTYNGKWTLKSGM